MPAAEFFSVVSSDRMIGRSTVRRGLGVGVRSPPVTFWKLQIVTVFEERSTAPTTVFQMADPVLLITSVSALVFFR